MYRHIRRSLLALGIAAASALSYAAPSGMENDALTISQARITLAQAVAAAERHANGKAARAELERTPQGWAYDVEVVNGSKVLDVRVDASKGTVISSAADQVDRDDGRDPLD